MNRRTLLTSISVGMATVAGCIGKLNRDENDEPKYEECNWMVINYRTLPEDVKTEVDTAFNEGQYVSDEELLWQQVAGPEVEWLLRRGTYYAPQVNVDNGAHTLQFEETTPQFETKYLSVGSELEEPRDISITIKDSEGTVLQETKITGGDGGSSVPIASEFGTYLVEVTVEDLGTVTEELTLHPYDNSIFLRIDARKSSLLVNIAVDPDEGEGGCSWNNQYSKGGESSP